MPMYNYSIGARSPYGALMYLRATGNPNACVHDIIDTPDTDLNFEDRSLTSSKSLFGRAMVSNNRYWCYTHKKLNDNTYHCDISCKFKCWGGLGAPPGATV